MFVVVFVVFVDDLVVFVFVVVIVVLPSIVITMNIPGSS